LLLKWTTGASALGIAAMKARRRQVLAVDWRRRLTAAACGPRGFGVLPQVLPVVAGQILYFIESNTRSATIIGVVGAGGIGLHLSEQIRVLEWKQVSFLILLILVSVTAIDYVSGKLRAAMAGQHGVAA
jgi:ABC-type phosphate/phosphonate transport system permease subunit